MPRPTTSCRSARISTRALALRQVADALGESFRLTLRIASPYVIYALIVNLALALVNRLTPQIQIFFVATPFVVAGGLALLYFTIKPAIEAFLTGFGAWLISARTNDEKRLDALTRLGPCRPGCTISAAGGFIRSNASKRD